uniref:Rho-related protein racA-like n=1 Tax=Saccoglossus kowalevskii TaxID=10224 RepID=A0ABM0GQH0_SACKO
MSAARNIKCVVVGDGAVGKTCMLWVYTHNAFPQEYVPTVVTLSRQLYIVCIKVSYFTDNLLLENQDGGLHDTNEKLKLENTDVFIVCFSIISEPSYDNVSVKWNPELTNHVPEAPKILVGTKIDLRDNKEIISKLTEKGKAPLKKEA